MGLKISPDELEAALSGSSRNIRLEKMLASWTSQIKDLMLELADKKEADKDVKDIRTILQERLFGVAVESNSKCKVNRHLLLDSTPKRRHKERNFASLISARLSSLLGIPFYEDIAECHSKHRVGAVFTFGKELPTERNIIVFDDFVTSGATMISMRELLLPLGYNLVFFTGINNKL